MANRVFFTFHYQDVADFRANVVRNHWLTKERQEAGFFDASIWEESQKKGDLALKRLINGALEQTSVTCALVGSETYNRRWVKYEIMKSLMRGNSLLAIHINNIQCKNKTCKPLGKNPFDYLGFTISSDGKTLNPLEYKGNKWIPYSDLSSYKLTSSVPKSYWDQGKKLSEIFPIYCWVNDKGYDNFKDWLK